MPRTRYNCSNTALHISCGDWFNTKLKAQQDSERRCTGYGQPEFYKPTNEEHIRSIIRRNSGAQLIDRNSRYLQTHFGLQLARSSCKVVGYAVYPG